MRRSIDEQPDLDLVAEYLFERKLIVERFTHLETQTGKTPDFRVMKNGQLVAFCEIKSPNDPWLETLIEEAPPMTIVGGSRDDPTFNRIARLLVKAVEQFDAVNHNRDALNILAYVNHDGSSNYYDLVETLTGFFYANDGSKVPTMLHISEGRIREIKRKVDVFMWFDGKSGHMEGIFINDLDQDRVKRACALLKIDIARVTSK